MGKEKENYENDGDDCRRIREKNKVSKVSNKNIGIRGKRINKNERIMKRDKQW